MLHTEICFIVTLMYINFTLKIHNEVFDRIQSSVESSFTYALKPSLSAFTYSEAVQLILCLPDRALVDGHMKVPATRQLNVG